MQTLNYSGLERETGLEPATACLEGSVVLSARRIAALDWS